MNLKLISVLTISLAGVLTACQTTVPSQSRKDAGANQTESQQGGNVKQNLKQSLQAYTWSYQPNTTQKPIVLSFQENRMGIHAGCNSMGTDVKIEDGKLKTGNIVSTMMACEPAIMKQEQFAASIFQKQELKVDLNSSHPDQPVLTVHAANGQKYQFTGTATAETRYQGQAETVFLEISPETKACVGVAPQQCLQVREIKYDAQGLKTSTGKWELFYSQIEGFKHQPQQRVILRVKRFTIQNPAADQSKYAYVKDMVVEQELIK